MGDMRQPSREFTNEEEQARKARKQAREAYKGLTTAELTDQLAGRPARNAESL